MVCLLLVFQVDKMKSREGTVVDADDLMEAMIETAKETSAELGKVSMTSPSPSSR